MSAETRALIADVAVALQAMVESHYEPEVVADRMAYLLTGAGEERVIVVTVTMATVITECTRRMYGIPKGSSVRLITARLDTETNELTEADLPPLDTLSEGARAAVNAGRLVTLLGDADVETAGGIVVAAVNAGPREVAGLHIQLIQMLHGAEHATGIVPAFIEPV